MNHAKFTKEIESRADKFVRDNTQNKSEVTLTDSAFLVVVKTAMQIGVLIALEKQAEHPEAAAIETEIVDFYVLVRSSNYEPGTQTFVKIQIPVIADPITGEKLLTPAAHSLIEATHAEYYIKKFFENLNKSLKNQ